MCLHDQILVAGDYRGGFSEEQIEAFPMANKANCCCSKMDMLLAKAEPTSDAVSASGIMHLRRRGKIPATADRERSDNMGDNQL